MLSQVLAHIGDAIVAAPSEPPATDGAGIVNTSGVTKFFATQIGPIIAAFIGVGIIIKANRGQVGQSMTSTFLVVLGAALVVGGGLMFTIGDKIINMLFG